MEVEPGEEEDNENEEEEEVAENDVPESPSAKNKWAKKLHKCVRAAD